MRRIRILRPVCLQPVRHAASGSDAVLEISADARTLPGVRYGAVGKNEILSALRHETEKKKSEG
jgi:hypothetical protein